MFIKRYFFLAILLALFVGCEKDEEAVKVIDVPKVYFGNRGIVIEWKPTDIEGFKYYQVLRSTNGKDFTVIHGLSTTDSSAYDVNNTTYTDIAYPFADFIYYKIEASGNEKIESPKAGLALPAPMILDYHPISGYMMPDKEEILFFTDGAEGPKYSLFDYKNGVIKKELPLEVKTIGYCHGFGKFNGNYECYFYDDFNPKMNIYDANSLDFKASFDFNDSYANVASDLSSFIYYRGWGNINILNRNTLTREIFDSNVSGDLDRIYFMEGQNKLLGITSSRDIYLYKLGDPGTITGEEYKKLSETGLVNYIPGTKYIYTKTRTLDSLKIINTETWEKKRLLNEHNQPINTRTLHAKNGVLYACSSQRMYCYSLENLELIEHFPTRIDPQMLLSDDNDLILIGKYKDYLTIIDKMELSE